MKELSIEEKAKAYDKAVERAIAWRKKYDNFISEDGTMIQDFYNIFPDLKESEDDRIMRAIVRFIHMEVEDEKVGNKWIAWLKKKCQVKDSAISQHENKTCKENEDSLTREDDRVRKAIHIYLDWLDGRKDYAPKGVYTIRDMITWIEKQGDHANFLSKIQVGDKVTRNEDGVLVNLSQLNRVAKKRGEQKLTDKVEQKFKVGNWYQCTKDFFGKGVTFDKNTAYYCAEEGCLKNEYGCHIAIVKDLYDNFKLWTIKDAKDGDVLYSQKGGGVECIHLIHRWGKIPLTGNTLCSMCTYRMEDNKIIAGGIGAVWWEGVKDKFTPATKEQRDLLFKKMHEAGYELDAEKKELKKIDQNFILNEIQPKQITPEEPAWSVEDEINRDLVYNALNQVYDMAQNKDLSAWFNRIIFRYAWKPSDGQIQSLQGAIGIVGELTLRGEILKELVEQLKKLREE